MQTPYTDPNDPSSPQQKLLQALMGGTPIPMDPSQQPIGNDMPSPPPITGTINNGQGGSIKVGDTTQPAKTELPGTGTSASSASAYDTTGLDPNNPIDAVFIKNKYKQNGQGSGFGDLAYWRAHPDQAARLDADQQGHGTDMPGPGDTGNTSFDPNAGRGGGSGASFGVNPLSFLSNGQNSSDPVDSILSRILAALNQYGGG